MPLTIKRRGKVWHYSGTVAGRRLRGTTGTEDKKRAERIAAETEARAWKRHLDGPGAGLTMAQAAIAYRKSGKPTRFLVKVEDHFRETPVAEITGEVIRQAAIKVYPTAKAATRNRQFIVPAQAMINHAADLGWCPHIKVRRFPETRVRKDPATLAWVDAFVAHASPHLGALVLFMFATGARISEAVRLTWEDVDLPKGTARLSGSKPTPWVRTAHMPPRLVAAIANIPSNRQPDEPVFRYSGRGSVKTAWATVVQVAGIDPLPPHSCRHGFATTMLHKGFDVNTVAEAGGWRDPTVVLRTYGHALKDRTVTDAVFGTNLAQGADTMSTSAGKDGRKAQ